MSRAIGDLLAEAIELPVPERPKLASELVASIDDGPPDADWDAAGLAELDRCVEAARNRGRTPAPEWSGVRARILSRLARR